MRLCEGNMARYLLDDLGRTDHPAPVTCRRATCVAHTNRCFARGNFAGGMQRHLTTSRFSMLSRFDSDDS
jgi:hypothetical protein